jgi:hypothetical protein
MAQIALNSARPVNVMMAWTAGTRRPVQTAPTPVSIILIAIPTPLPDDFLAPIDVELTLTAQPD